jgi:hypothetical protein
VIVIKLEMWPKGDHRHARILGVGSIENDNTGSDDLGNYIVRLLKSPEYAADPSTRTVDRQLHFPLARELWRCGEVKGFPRQSRGHGPWDLLYRALRATVAQRNGDAVSCPRCGSPSEAPTQRGIWAAYTCRSCGARWQIDDHAVPAERRP